MAEDGISVTVSGGIPATSWQAVAQALRDDLVRRLAYDAKARWKKEAYDVLKTTKTQYADEIQDPEINEGMATVVLTGMLANRIENGWAAYDLHDTLLGDGVPVVPARAGQRGKHQKKDGSGFYRTIPFRHQGPGTVGREGAPIGSAYSKEMGSHIGEPLAKVVYRMAKSMSVSKRGEDGKMNWAASLPRNVMPKLRAHHSDSIYAGMYRVQHEYGQGPQTTLRTFRTIATGSPGWRVDAKPGIHLAPKVADYVTSIAQETLDSIVQTMKEGGG